MPCSRCSLVSATIVAAPKGVRSLLSRATPSRTPGVTPAHALHSLCMRSHMCSCPTWHRFMALRWSLSSRVWWAVFGTPQADALQAESPATCACGRAASNRRYACYVCYACYRAANEARPRALCFVFSCSPLPHSRAPGLWWGPRKQVPHARLWCSIAHCLPVASSLAAPGNSSPTSASQRARWDMHAISADAAGWTSKSTCMNTMHIVLPTSALQSHSQVQTERITGCDSLRHSAYMQTACMCP